MDLDYAPPLPFPLRPPPSKLQCQLSCNWGCGLPDGEQHQAPSQERNTGLGLCHQLRDATRGLAGDPTPPNPALAPAWSCSLSYASSALTLPPLLSIRINAGGGGRAEVEWGLGGATKKHNSPGSQEPGFKWQDAGARTPNTHTRTHTHARTHRRALRPRFYANPRQDRRKKGGGVARRPGVTGRDIPRRAGDASGTAKVRKSQTPFTSPSLGSPASSPGSPSFQLGSGSGEGGRSRASPRLPSRAWPRARNPAPFQPRPEEAARQGETCQRTLGEQEGRREASCTLRPVAGFFLCRHTPSESPSPAHTHTHRHACSPLSPSQVHRLKH